MSELRDPNRPRTHDAVRPNVWERLAEEAKSRKAKPSYKVVEGNILYPCPGCKRELRIPVLYEGTAGKCNHCAQPIRVPVASS